MVTTYSVCKIINQKVMAQQQSIPPIFSLIPNVMHYLWGHIGPASLVAQLLQHQGTHIIQDRPYAELWMGTHKNAPSFAQLDPAQPLTDAIQSNPSEFLGPLHHLQHEFLPFLMKVLSVSKPLSIQAHPDKSLASTLHAKYPDLYKDCNHKPEMVIALTNFKAMVGFRTLCDIQSNLNLYPEWALLIGSQLSNEILNSSVNDDDISYKRLLKRLFSAVVLADEMLVSTTLAQLVARVSKIPHPSVIDHHLVSFHTEFPGDVGVFSILFMNLVFLEPGDSLYLGANELHAYVSGDCIEVMASSDNVIRAGLTPKYKDTATLIEMLNYNTSTHKVVPTTVHQYPNTWIYQPPIAEFQIQLSKTSAPVSVPVNRGPSIAIITHGTGTLRASKGGHDLELAVKPGSVVYILPNVPLTLVPDQLGPDNQVVMYQALCQDEFFA